MIGRYILIYWNVLIFRYLYIDFYFINSKWSFAGEFLPNIMLASINIISHSADNCLGLMLLAQSIMLQSSTDKRILSQLKESLFTYLVPGLGRLKQLRIKTTGFLRHLSVNSMCPLYMLPSTWWFKTELPFF